MSQTFNLPSPSHCLANSCHGTSDPDKVLCRNYSADKTNIVVYYDSDKRLAYMEDFAASDAEPNTAFDYDLFRSVIISNVGETQKYVGFSPPHIDRVDSLEADSSSISSISQEYVDGTMINLFYDANASPPCWEIATRRIIGGHNSYHTLGKDTITKTFRELFDECCKACLFSETSLNTDRCYSFVIQHPENRIVTPVYVPTLFLIGEYEFIDQDDSTVMVKAYDIYKTEVLDNTLVRRPLLYSLEMLQQYVSPNADFSVKGVVSISSDGKSTVKYLNSNYERIREIRGNQAKLQYHYLEMCQLPRASIAIGEFVRYYPEYKKVFYEYSHQIKKYINHVYSSYIDVFIKKAKTLKQVDAQYRKLVYELHNDIYLVQLRPNNKRVNKFVVMEFIHALPCARLMYYLNRTSDETPKEPKLTADPDVYVESTVLDDYEHPSEIL